MERRFSEALEAFAKSIDTVDTEVLNSVKSCLKKYFEEALQINFYEIQIYELTRKNEPFLRTKWSSDKPDVTPIHNEKGLYTGQSTFAFDIDKEIWITGEGGERLADSKTYRDWWSRLSGLPEYWNYASDLNVRTSIVIPIRYGDVKFGILTLESNEYIEGNSIAIAELSRVAKAAGIIFHLHSSCEASSANSRDVLQSIQSLIPKTGLMLKKPRVFVASSSADLVSEVQGVIIEVLDKFSENIEIINWRTISTSGDVNSQILENIQNCQYGICYFSEPVNDSSTSDYRDNPNVVFEAGMLHALTNSLTGEPKAWIPIREQSSPKTPFDFAAQRTIEIKRGGQDGMELNVDKLKTDLKEAISAMLK